MLMKSEYGLTKDLFLEREKLKTQLKAVEKEIEKKEKELLKRLEKGEKISWCWKYVFERTYVPWKDFFIGLVGKEQAEKMAEKTLPRKYEKIHIKGIHEEDT